MAKVIFSIKYEIIPSKREEYLNVMSELKNLVKAVGLVEYSLYQVKNKKNSFEEIHVFESVEAYENFEDTEDERKDILINKLSDMIKQNTTHYSTLFEVE